MLALITESPRPKFEMITPKPARALKLWLDVVVRWCKVQSASERSGALVYTTGGVGAQVHGRALDGRATHIDTCVEKLIRDEKRRPAAH